MSAGSIRFTCPMCQTLMSIAPEHAGGKTQCPKCGQRLLVPTPPAAPPSNRTVLGELAPQPPAAVVSESKTPPMAILVGPLPQSRGRVIRLPPGWRFASPSFLGVVLLMFFLPWVEIRCDSVQGRRTLATESGFQAIYGGVSLNPALEAERDQRRMRSRDTAPGLDSPFMLLFLTMTIAGVVISFLPLSGLRRIFFAAPSLAALGLVMIQMLVGFPLERRAYHALSAAAAEGRSSLGALAFDVHYTSWLWLALLCLVLSSAATIVEAHLAGDVAWLRTWLLATIQEMGTNKRRSVSR